jgi:radical SAM protein with 4Fe4S-binding SPASM domain
MINLTRLLCESAEDSDVLHNSTPRSVAGTKPSVVWNITRRCNLKCQHCHSDSYERDFPGELNWEECRNLIDSLAAFGVRSILFSGGEPLAHPLFFYIAGYSRERGLRITLATNGTLITPDVARKLRAIGISYTGILLNGVGAVHDKFCGVNGAFEKTVAALRACRKAGLKTGVRVNLAQHTFGNLDAILDFIDEENIQRVCFYHLVYCGRGVKLSLLEPGQTRAALDKITDRVEAWNRAGKTREVLTYDQPADAPYLFLRLQKNEPERAAQVFKMIRAVNGDSTASGVGIASIDTQGNVHPDRFWQDYKLGNVREQLFSSIWLNEQDSVLRDLRTRPRPIHGRCARCRFFNLCGGGFRARAWQRYGDPWAEDPDCYLTDEEIADKHGARKT